MGLYLDEDILKSNSQETVGSLVAAIDIGGVIGVHPLQAYPIQWDSLSPNRRDIHIYEGTGNVEPYELLASTLRPLAS